jgi:hypothetical protein
MGIARETTSASAPSSVLASQAALSGSQLTIFGKGPLLAPSPVVGFTANTRTGNVGLFGTPKDLQPVNGKTQNLNAKHRSPFGSSGSGFKGEASSNTSSSLFGPARTPNLSTATNGSSIGDSSKPSSNQPNPFSFLTPGNPQRQGENTVPVTQLSNSSQR